MVGKNGFPKEGLISLGLVGIWEGGALLAVHYHEKQPQVAKERVGWCLLLMAAFCLIVKEDHQGIKVLFYIRFNGPNLPSWYSKCKENISIQGTLWDTCLERNFVFLGVNFVYPSVGIDDHDEGYWTSTRLKSEVAVRFLLLNLGKYSTQWNQWSNVDVLFPSKILVDVVSHRIHVWYYHIYLHLP